MNYRSPLKPDCAYFCIYFYSLLSQQSAASALFIRFACLWANAFQISALKILDYMLNY